MAEGNLNLRLHIRATLLTIRIWQVAFSPLFGARCRFEPSCSHYARDALLRYGLLKGGFLSIKRICKCNTLFAAGADPLV